ncbi:MAG: hypothetical protein P8189_15015 [Anaerolineae bacterium]
MTISTLNEKPLHAALKEWYAQPGDQLEVPVDRFIADIVRGNLLIEIQTASFSSIKQKLLELTAHHPVRLVYPIARQKWIVKVAEDRRTQLSRRKSPKRGRVEDVFAELVSFPTLLASPNFSLEVLFIQEEEVRHHDPKRGWRRRGWLTHERRLLAVVDRQHFETPADMANLLPTTLPEPFTTSDLAASLPRPRRLAQRMAYCLREMQVIDPVGKQGNAILYVRTAN